MRVRWLHQNLVTHAEAGNARATFTLRALVEAGHEVDVIAADRTYLGERVPGPRERHERGLRIVRVAVGRGSKAAIYARFAANALRAGRGLPKPDLVLVSSPPLPGVLPGLGLARALGVPAALEIRDLWPAFLLEGGLLAAGRFARALEALEVGALHAASSVLSVSPGFLPYLQALRPDIQVDAALTGCDPDFGSGLSGPEPAWLDRVCDPADARPLVVYTGSLNEAYGIELLLDLARTREDCRFVIVGAGRLRDRVEEAARQLPQLSAPGSLPRVQVPHLLARAHVGVNLHAPWPLLGTTLTGKLFDYLACGVGVLDLAGGCMGRLVRRARAGAHAERSVAAASRALDEVLADRDAGRRGRAFGLRYLDAPTEARRVVRHLEAASNAARVGLGRGARAGRTRKPARVLSEVYGDDPAGVAVEALDAWLDRRRPTERVEPLPRLECLGGR